MSKGNVERKKKYEEKRSGQRSRNWTCVMYPDDLPSDWIEKVNSECLKWVCSPLHDKDLNADGQLKKAHYHTLFMFDNVKSKALVIELFTRLFGSVENSICGVATPQICSDKTALTRYMAHIDNPEKVQYEASDIIGYGGADVSELLAHTRAELVADMVAIEEFIDDNNITELCDLMQLIRYDKPDWYLLIATKSTLYFTNYIRSRRHKLLGGGAVENRLD